MVSIMAEKMWPARKSCKQQYKGSDQLSLLPDELLLSVTSFLTMKDTARTSVLSHRWKHLWRYSPVLIFEDSAAALRLKSDDGRLNFLRWVNGVLDAHLGQTIDELKVVAFHFNSSCQTHMDEWVNFALAKQVKRLELDFETSFCYRSSCAEWNMSLYYQPHNLSAFKSCLRSLCLRYVDITTENVNCLLRSCTILENLCIKSSPSLSHIRACAAPLQLKHFEVSECHQLEVIDIFAPKLLSFMYTGSRAIKLHVRNASLLSKVSVSFQCIGGADVVADSFVSLSNYISQLECLSLELLSLYIPSSGVVQHPYVEFNLGVPNPPAMTNLKHLNLCVNEYGLQNLLGWVDLIEASPLLQRLTVKILAHLETSYKEMAKHNGRPLKSLKTLELRGHLGYPIVNEFATCIIENSTMLKDVIVDFEEPLCEWDTMLGPVGFVAKLKRVAPKGCKVHATYKGSKRCYQELL